MHQLVAGVLRVGERIEPRLHAYLHVREQKIQRHRGNACQKQAYDQVKLSSAGEIQHGDEHEEEHQRAAQVLLEHHNDNGNRPHEQQGQQRAHVGQLERSHAPREHREHFAVAGKVARQE